MVSESQKLIFILFVLVEVMLLLYLPGYVSTKFLAVLVEVMLFYLPEHVSTKFLVVLVEVMLLLHLPEHVSSEFLVTDAVKMLEHKNLIEL